MSSLTDPQVENHLISEEGEVIVDEVRRHPLAFVTPTLIILLGLAVAALSFVIPPEFATIPLGIGCVVMLFGVYRALFVHMDRFVITNMRVFRIHGIFTQHKATMPMARILDISVHKPLMGRIFRYGHFVFESAAQDQGLRDIRYVGRPDERDLTIQTVIQRSGLRATIKSFNSGAEDDDDDDSTVDDLLTDEDLTAHDSHAESGELSERVFDTGAESTVDTEEWNTMELDVGYRDAASEEFRVGSALPVFEDSISAAAGEWELRWPERNRMQAATELMHAHRRLITDLDEKLRPLGLTYARYEILLLLFFESSGALPLVELTDRLQVEASSSFHSVRWLEENCLIERTLEPGDDGEVVAELTPKGRALTDRASHLVADIRFGLGTMSTSECHQLTALLSRQRRATE
ncbi:PH domain-containing protein [Brevibacterium siliguriense]|uniref:PH domain-containing protein n=1 Tax=Brevibacterium siliguriense TaxID=1136497 RepID=UPI000B85D89A|nr:PH domain-containing protein [Brevibacterium siliguriense]